MKKSILLVLLSALLFTDLVLADHAPLTNRVYDLKTRKTVALNEMVATLKQYRMILVGELHTAESHHIGQLRVIQALHEAGVPVAVGLEMFRTGSQTELDNWIAGKTKEKDFEKIYYKNWNYDWQLYRMIFAYARQEKIPMVALNVPPEVTRQVAYHGFKSLSSDQKGKLPAITCDVSEDYRTYIREAYGAHGHGKMNFEYFCEAQLVWDKSMALNALDYLTAHPDRVMVVIAGSGHARKGGIPSQIQQRSSLPVAVIIPEVSGYLDEETVTLEDADFLLKDLF